MLPGTILKLGDVVQIGPQPKGFFTGCFMLVTEPKAFGAQGFVSMPGELGTIPGRAYCRIKWEDMELIGRAEWIPVDEESAATDD